jgi:hypothetical protein
MTNETKAMLLVSAGMLALCGALIALMLWLKAEQCTARWEHSGMAAKWGPIQGCLVQRRDGTWVPASAVRDLAP